MIYLSLREGVVSERRELKESSIGHWHAVLKGLPVLVALLRFYVCSWWRWDSMGTEIEFEVLNVSAN